jgi:uncharacterized repeat protein (TIGR01451 family)
MSTDRRAALAARAAKGMVASLMLAFGATAASAQPAVLISKDEPFSLGGDAASFTSDSPRNTVSDDGCLVVFVSRATNLVAGQADVNGSGEDVFLYDHCAGGKVKLVSRSKDDPDPANARRTSDGVCKDPVISSDGAFVAFACTSTDLIAGQNDTNNNYDVFIWDNGAATRGTVELVSHVFGDDLRTGTSPSNPESSRPVINRNGQLVAYESEVTAAQMVFNGNEKNDLRDVYLYDRLLGPSTDMFLVSHNNADQFTTANQDSFEPVVSANGAFVAFTSKGTDVVLSQVEGNSGNDVFRYQVSDRNIKLISARLASPMNTATGESDQPTISGDGQRVAFRSLAPDVTGAFGDFNNKADIYFFDGAEWFLLSRDASGPPPFDTAGDGDCSRPAISVDGKFVAYESQASNLAPGQVDATGFFDVFAYDLTRLSPTFGDGNTLVSHLWSDPKAPGSKDSTNAQISMDGQRIAFVSKAKDLIFNQVDGEDTDDVFVWDSGFNASALASSQVSTSTTTGNGPSDTPALSGSGRFVAFHSRASNLFVPDPNGSVDDAFYFEAAFADLRISKSSSGFARAGGPLSYTIVVENLGPDPVVGASVGDGFPPQLQGVSWTCSPAGGATCTPSGTGDIADSVNLPLGSSVTYSASGTLALTPTTGFVMNTADVFPPPSPVDPVSSNNSDSVSDPLMPETVLSLTHADAPDPVLTGAIYSYVTKVQNVGAFFADNVFLQFGIPGGTVFLSVDNPACIFGGSLVTCTNLVDLNPGQAFVVTTTLRAPGSPTTLSSSATAASATTTVMPTVVAQTTVVDAASSLIRFFTATAKPGNNTLEWLTPTAGYALTKILWRDNGTCPTGPNDGASSILTINVMPGPGAKGKHLHSLLVKGRVYCYAAYVDRNGTNTVFSAGKFVKARPFDNAVGQPEEDVRWAFSTGGTAVTPPSIGASSVLAPSNDNALYAMMRGGAGGTWPVGPSEFWPFGFPEPVQNRGPVIPLTLGTNSSRAILLGSQDGNVYAVDVDRGSNTIPAPPVAAPLWSSSITPVDVQGAPAAMFSAFGGLHDVVMVGSRQSGPNSFQGLNPFGGAPLWSYAPPAAPGPIGAINGGAAVDYANSRVFFTSRQEGTGHTVWALDFTDSPVTPTLAWSFPHGNVDSSPVLRNGRVYVGNNLGTVQAFRAAPPVQALWSSPGPFLVVDPSGPAIKGFVFPDRQGTQLDLYFSTGSQVWGITDTGGTGALKPGWPVTTIPNPSIPVFGRIGGIAYVWVGSSDGRLYQIDAATGGIVKSVELGGGGSAIGAPSLDVTNNLIYVGSDAGVIYAVSALP